MSTTEDHTTDRRIPEGSDLMPVAEDRITEDRMAGGRLNIVDFDKIDVHDENIKDVYNIVRT